MVAKYPDLAEDLIYSDIAPTGSEVIDPEVQDKVAKYIPLRSLDEAWLLSRPTQFLKNSSENLCSSSTILPRSSVAVPELDKVASISYAVYISTILDTIDNPSYTKLASIRSQDTEGLRDSKSRPWTALTVLALNHI